MNQENSIEMRVKEDFHFVTLSSDHVTGTVRTGADIRRHALDLVTHSTVAHARAVI